MLTSLTTLVSWSFSLRPSTCSVGVSATSCSVGSVMAGLGSVLSTMFSCVVVFVYCPRHSRATALSDASSLVSSPKPRPFFLLMCLHMVRYLVAYHMIYSALVVFSAPPTSPSLVKKVGSPSVANWLCSHSNGPHILWCFLRDLSQW